MQQPRWPLAEAIRRLRAHYGKPAPLPATDPFAMVLWECCAYLVDDEHRKLVFDRLIAKTQGDPTRIAAMKPGALMDLISADGGMQPAMRAEKLQRAANLTIDIGREELARLCKSDPVKARRVLKKFPGIGDPGADKILMVSGSLTTLGLDSNGLRVLQRLGFGAPSKDYTKAYRSVMADVSEELPTTTPGLVSAHQLLRQHGKTLCKAGVPICSECPLSARCPSAI